MINKSNEDETFVVGEIYRYIGDGEWEIFDLMAFIQEALNKSLGEKLP